MMASSPICLLSKASKTKSWLWHRRLSHLNFSAINHLARQGLVRGLPKLKFEKDHLCSACAMGKSTRKAHKPKSEDTNQEKLYLLHMDLCGPMPSNEELKEPMEDQPLPANASPTALSPGYVVDSDLEKDAKDLKEDPADYPVDRGDNDDDESSNDNDDDDDMILSSQAENTEAFETNESASTP
nr:retrovirus-related Pol polyprotein from transposon TNT 1-94 [Tanacetum cinerariifolium]